MYHAVVPVFLFLFLCVATVVPTTTAVFVVRLFDSCNNVGGLLAQPTSLSATSKCLRVTTNGTKNNKCARNVAAAFCMRQLVYDGKEN